MFRLSTEWNPSRAHLRTFGWGIALLLAAVAWRQNDALPKVIWQGAAGLVFAAGTLWPQTLRGLYVALLVVTYPVRRVVSFALLAAVFFGLLTPLALWFQWIGRDGLRRRLEPETATYWQPRAPMPERQQYYRQF